MVVSINILFNVLGGRSAEPGLISCICMDKLFQRLELDGSRQHSEGPPNMTAPVPLVIQVVTLIRRFQVINRSDMSGSRD